MTYNAAGALLNGRCQWPSPTMNLSPPLHRTCYAQPRNVQFLVRIYESEVTKLNAGNGSRCIRVLVSQGRYYYL